MSNSNPNKCFDPVFGDCTEFSLDKLPTKADFIKNILFLKRGIKQFSSIKPYIKETIKRLKKVWSKSFIKIIGDKSIERSATKLLNKHNLVLRNENRPNYLQKLDMFRNEMESTLFDISTCRCKDHCNCPYDSKIYRQQISFLNDQRNERTMFLGEIDETAAHKAERREKDGF